MIEAKTEANEGEFSCVLEQLDAPSRAQQNHPPALTRGASPVLSARCGVVEDGASRMEILMTVSKFASFCTMVSARQSHTVISQTIGWYGNRGCAVIGVLSRGIRNES